MATVFVVHGKENNPSGNWFPWLKEEMEKLGHRVFVPQFPTPENQTLPNWLKVFEKYRGHVTSDTIVVGHSLGVPFLLTIVEKNPVKAAFFISGFVNNPLDESVQTFCRPFNWEQIKRNCKYFRVFHSDNDPYFGLEKGEELARNLGTKVIFVKGAGHFNLASGYNKFDLLLAKIRSIMI